MKAADRACGSPVSVLEEVPYSLQRAPLPTVWGGARRFPTPARRPARVPTSGHHPGSTGSPVSSSREALPGPGAETLSLGVAST